jgi:hypothetical protein
MHNTTIRGDTRPEPVVAEANRFIEALTGSQDTPITFQTFPEGGPSPLPAQVIHGTLADQWEQLCGLNEAGHGIFVMINEGDGKGRKATNVVRLRAVFTDDDGIGQAAPPLSGAVPPSLVVQSASGRHTYWRLGNTEDVAAFSAIQKALAKHFGTDPRVHDLPRVMRVPGFFHLKDRTNPFLVRVLDDAGHRYTIKQVADAFSLEIEKASAPARSQTPRVTQPAGQAAITYVDSAIAVRRARAYLGKVPGAKQGERDSTVYTVACVLIRDFALPQEVALGLLREWNDEKVDPPLEEDDLVAKLEHAGNYATGAVGTKLTVEAADYQSAEDLCFVVPHDRYYFRRQDGQWESGLPLTQNAAKRHLRTRDHSSKNIGNIIAHDLLPIASGLDCAPGEGPLFVRDGELVVNTHRPSEIVPAPGDYPRIQQMIQVLTDGDAEGAAWLFNWMAGKYQDPGKLSGTAPVFQGAQGLGKTLLGLIFAEILGSANTASISQPDLDGSFNGHFVEKLFVIADEVVSQQTIRDNTAILKKYITDPFIMGNVKSVPQHQVINRMSWWFTSNSAVPVRVEGPHDRRYTVFAAMHAPAPEYTAMLRGIHAARGGYTDDFKREMAAFAHSLKTHEVDRHLARTPYQNEARAKLIDAGRSSEELFWEEVRQNGIDEVLSEYAGEAYGVAPPAFAGGDPRVDAVYAAYKHFCDGSGFKVPATKERLGQQMRFFFPNAQRRKVSQEGTRVYVYSGLPRTVTMG